MNRQTRACFNSRFSFIVCLGGLIVGCSSTSGDHPTSEGVGTGGKTTIGSGTSTAVMFGGATSVGQTNASGGVVLSHSTATVGGGTNTFSGAGTSSGGSIAATGGAKTIGIGGTVIAGGGSSGTAKASTGGSKSIGTGGTFTSGGASALGGTTATTDPSVVIGVGGTRTACAKPAGYRNLFVEILGKTQSEVDAKVTAAAKQLFHGNTDQAIYFEYGTDQAYIEDIPNKDVRSEGMSYGMTIAVQLDMKEEFDKLWTYAVKCMRQSNGLFAWQMNPNSCAAISTFAAPDGEEYFATALMLASRRWGDSGAYNYGNEAKKVMAAMLTTRPAGEFNSNPNLISFGPNQNFSDPSYVLPLFYSEWACFDSVHTSFWTQATTDARAFFKKATNSSTGLAPGLANWDGSIISGRNDYFNNDAWRVPMNIMMDFNLNNADSTWQTTFAKTNAAFWVKEGLSSYGIQYNLDGSGKKGEHGSGLTGVNAMLAFALPTADGKQFLQAAWDAPIPSGTGGNGRYYDGCLYLLSMLHMSGKFRLYY